MASKKKSAKKAPARKKPTLKETLGRDPNKAEKFTYLAEQRMTKALKSLKHIQNLANRSQYEYTEQQAQVMVDALDAAVEHIKDRFSQSPAAVKSEGFKF